MTEVQAKQHLKQMLRSFTAGSVLALLGEIFVESALKFRRRDAKTAEQRQEVRSTLFVVGMGIDAACPHSRQLP